MKITVFILTMMLLVFGVQSMSYGQTLSASTDNRLTEATLHESVVTLTLSGGVYAHQDIVENAVTVSGIDGLTIAIPGVTRVSDTKVTVKLEFDGTNFDIHSPLFFTVEPGAIANYNGDALTAEIVVRHGFPIGSTFEKISGDNQTGSPGTRLSDPFEVTVYDQHGTSIKGVLVTFSITVGGGSLSIQEVRTDDFGKVQSTLTLGPNLGWNQVEVRVDGVSFPQFFTATIAAQDIQGPWLWMVAPTNPGGASDISSEIDSLAKVSGGAVTETHVARNGVNEGDTVGEQHWISAKLDSRHKCITYDIRLCFDPTVCWADNINTVVSALGIGTGANTRNHSVYALITLVSPHEQTGQMSVESGDAIKVWLDGEVVHRESAENLGCRSIDVSLACDPKVCRPDPSRGESKKSSFPVTLKSGNNLLLVKVRQHGDYWDMRVELDVGFTTAIPTTKTVADVPSPVTPDRSTTNTTLSLSPSSVVSPAVGEQLTLSLNIAGGKNVAGYEATVQFDTTALRYVSSANGDYLPDGAFFVPPVVDGNRVKLAGTSLAGESSGVGSLATVTFEVLSVKASTLTLSDVLFSNRAGERSLPQVEAAQITTAPQRNGDVNADGTINIQDLVLVASNLGQSGQNTADVNADGTVNIQDLVLVAGALGTSAAAPSLYPHSVEMPTATDVREWLSHAQHLPLTDAISQRGILFLEQLLVALIPKETVLLANYPNPFNPETWIPYQLAKPADVTLVIYGIDGQIVRRLVLGHQDAGIYQNRSGAAYWDGRNAFGEPVASGVYFYTLTADDFTATRKMLIRK